MKWHPLQNYPLSLNLHYSYAMTFYNLCLHSTSLTQDTETISSHRKITWGKNLGGGGEEAPNKMCTYTHKQNKMIKGGYVRKETEEL